MIYLFPVLSERQDSHLPVRKKKREREKTTLTLGSITYMREKVTSEITS